MPSKLKKPWGNVAVFERLSDGKELEEFLRSRRLEARTYNDKLLQLFLFLCPPHATFRVQVRANAFDAAMKLLDQTPEAQAILRRAILCPSCGSRRVQYPQMTRKFFLPTLLLHLGIIFRLVHHEAYCEKCHYLWNLPRPTKQELSKLKASAVEQRR